MRKALLRCGLSLRRAKLEAQLLVNWKVFPFFRGMANSCFSKGLPSKGSCNSESWPPPFIRMASSVTGECWAANGLYTRETLARGPEGR